MKLKELIIKNIDVLKKFSRAKVEITNKNVFQEGIPELQKILNSIISSLLLPGSKLIGSENLLKLSELAKNNNRCIILPEHYSNFDYPFIIKFFEDLGEKGKVLAAQCVAMAGIKLSEANDAISTLTDAYDRIYVYPGRYLKAITNKEILEAEIKKARMINFASMRQMEELRRSGRIIVVFPTGTRYRPGKPETKRGIREIDSYIKTSDYMILLSINGNCLEISKTGDMTQDIVKKDTIVLEASPPIDCKAFRNKIRANLQENEDHKQKLADTIMEYLEKMHNKNLSI